MPHDLPARAREGPVRLQRGVAVSWLARRGHGLHHEAEARAPFDPQA